MNLTLHDEHFRDPNVWNTHWYHVKEQNWKRRTLISEGSTILRVQQPTRQQTGDRFEVDVTNQFGLARGVSRILVTEGKSGLIYKAHFYSNGMLKYTFEITEAYGAHQIRVLKASPTIQITTPWRLYEMLYTY